MFFIRSEESFTTRSDLAVMFFNDKNDTAPKNKAKKISAKRAQAIFFSLRKYKLLELVSKKTPTNQNEAYRCSYPTRPLLSLGVAQQTTKVMNIAFVAID